MPQLRLRTRPWRTPLPSESQPPPSWRPPLFLDPVNIYELNNLKPHYVKSNINNSFLKPFLNLVLAAPLSIPVAKSVVAPVPVVAKVAAPVVYAHPSPVLAPTVYAHAPIAVAPAPVALAATPAVVAAPAIAKAAVVA